MVEAKRSELTAMTDEQFLEIRESDASPSVARIYGAIREATGLSFVNLAWRHMAALPGVLPWVWGIVGAAYRSGQVAHAAAGLCAAASELTLEPLRGDELARAGLDKAAQQVLFDLLNAYNRGNTQNLVGWSALLGYLRDHDGARREKPAEPAVDRIIQTPLPPVPPMPPLPRRDDLDPASAAAVARLSRLHESFPAGAVPSLYLHLATWPGLLEPIEARLRPALEARHLAKAVSKLSAIATTEARRLAPRLCSTVAGPPGDTRAAIEAKLETLTTGAVQEMLLVGVALRQALGRE